MVPDKPKLSELEAPPEDEVLCTEVFKNKTYEHVNYPPFVEEDKQDGPGELDDNVIIQLNYYDHSMFNHVTIRPFNRYLLRFF